MPTRRDFLKQAALLSGAGGILGALPASIQRAFAIDPEPGTTCFDAEHVVILMQENRSFDHCFGTLAGVRGFNDPRAITLPNKNLVWLQTNAAGETYAPFRLDIRDTKATWLGYLPHTWQSQVDARNYGKYDNWLEAKRSETKAYAEMPLTLGYYTREDLPFYYALADAFTICDQHFCSSLTGTMPNRLFFWSGTIRGPVPGAPAKVQNDDVEYESSAAWTTFPERLEDLGVSWKIYQNELSLKLGLTGEEEAWLANYGDNPLEWFTQYHTKFLPAYRDYLDRKIASLSQNTDPEAPKNPQLEKLKAEREKWSAENFDKLSQREKNLHEKAFCTNTGDSHYHELTKLRYRDGETEHEMPVPKGDVFHQFRQDVESGKLPTVSWLVAPERYSDHPSSPWYGIWYVSEALDILTQNPELWKKTIFILTYDENDGIYDHVPPFVAPNPSDRETGAVSKGIDVTSDYVTLEEQKRRKQGRRARESSVGLGYRVPMVVASPWSRGGYVCSQVFDHTSTLQFLEKFVAHKTGKKIEETNISTWRRAVCGDLTSAFRPYNGEPISLPSFVAHEPFVEGIHKAQFRRVPNDYKPLSPTEIEEINRNPASTPLLPRQERGTRPSCALPYEISADGKLNRAKQQFEVVFRSGNTFGAASAGSPFTAYAMRDYRRGTANPGSDTKWEKLTNWSFAVAPGDHLEYAWPVESFEGGVYHLHICGPNGFLREFLGSLNEPPLEIQLAYQTRGNSLADKLELHLSLPANASACPIEWLDNAYHQPAGSESIAPGKQKTLALDYRASFGWYDFTIKIRGCEPYARRFAGRIETGRPSKTDPAIG